MNAQQKILESILNALDKVSLEDYQNYVRPEYLKDILPFNPFSQRRYQGVIKLSLMIYNIFGYYKSNLYGTFKQITTAGGKIRKGAKGVDIIYYNPYMYNEKDKEKLSFVEYLQLSEQEQKKYVKRATTKIFKVFNFDYVTNVDDLNLQEFKQSNEVERNGDIDLFIDQINADIAYINTNVAYYAFEKDRIFMPRLDAYTSPDAYYAALLHELVHWSGHKQRLNRRSLYELNNNAKVYMEEEIIAEMGSLLLYTNFDLYNQFASSCAYIKNYYQYAGGDSDIIYKAFTEAQRAQRFLNECQVAEITI